MTKKVVGIQRDAKFTINGTELQGINLYLTYPSEKVLGVVTEKIFININKPCYRDANSLSVGDDVIIINNSYGKPEEIIPASWLNRPKN